MAVYTPVSETDLAGFLQAYDVGSARALARIEKGVENSNFYVETGSGRFILTLFEKRVAENDLPFFMALMHHLVAKGLPTAGPVARRDGTFLGELNNRPAALIQFVPGEDREELTPGLCAAAGAMLARLQLATRDFDQDRENDLSLAGWLSLAADCRERADECMPGLRAFIDDELRWLADHWPAAESLPRGVVHADLFPDNVLFSGNEITGVIDFYFACTDFYAYDLAVTLNAWSFDETQEFHTDRARALLAAYEEIRPLSDKERAALPVFARGACLRFLLTRLYDWLNRDPAALVQVKDPLEYLAKSRFHRENDFGAILHD